MMNIRTTLLQCWAGLTAAIILSSCGTTPVSLDYLPNPALSAPGPAGTIAVGNFVNRRDMSDFSLGTIRTPIGTPLEEVVTKVPIGQVVQNSFAYGLSSRKMQAAPGNAPYILAGDVVEFYCQQLVHPYAFAKINVTLIEARTGRVVFSHVYQAEREASAYIPMTGSPVPMLRELASRALQDVVDQSLKDAALRARIRPRSTAIPSGPNVL
jgi:hypothetical protein